MLQYKINDDITTHETEEIMMDEVLEARRKHKIGMRLIKPEIHNNTS